MRKRRENQGLLCGKQNFSLHTATGCWGHLLSLRFIVVISIIVIILCVGGHTSATAGMWTSGDNFKSQLSIPTMGSN